jgi:ABC-type thiamine transport system ATPase subunit
VNQLVAQIDQLEPGDDSARAVSARAERDWLTAQLASAAGLGGRTRSFPDQGERARVAVGKAIRRALARIDEADSAIGDHLRQTVHTGVRCSYWPS